MYGRIFLMLLLPLHMMCMSRVLPVTMHEDVLYMYITIKIPIVQTSFSDLTFPSKFKIDKFAVTLRKR